MNAWIDELHALSGSGDSSVMVTVASVRGSAPRETGAKMIVTGNETIGTIGGGQLEYQCSRIAVGELRNRAASEQRVQRRFPLGTNCGQCCGGVVDVLFERVASSPEWLRELKRLNDERRPVVVVTPLAEECGKYVVTEDRCMNFDTGTGCPREITTAARQMIGEHRPACVRDNYLLEPLQQCDFHIAVFGAGHVGVATVDILSKLDCDIRWVDSRRNIFPARLPENVTAIESGTPAREVAAMPGAAHYLVMTHSHPLDFEICDRILRREDFAYCGLIGSVSKRRRFERIMRKQTLPDTLIERLTCPIGLAGISSKKPADIAVAVAAELLCERDSSRAAQTDTDAVPENVHPL